MFNWIKTTTKQSKPATRSAPARRSYQMGNTNRLNRDFFSGSLSADQAIFSAIATARNRARWLERNDNHVRKFLIMAKTAVIGSKGIRLQSLAAELVRGTLVPSRPDQQLIESMFEEFSHANSFSVDGYLNRRRFAQVAFQRVLVDGEMIAIIHRGSDHPHGIALQLIDTELLDHELNRIASNNQNEIRMGVEVNAVGRPVAYHFLNPAPVTWQGTAASYGSHQRIPAADVIHLFIQERPGQTRGFTWLMATGERAKTLGAIEEAVSVGYRVAASKMGFFTRSEESAEAALDKDGNPVDLFSSELPLEANPAEFWELPPGVDFEAFDPGYPGANFDEFSRKVTRDMAAGLGISYPEFGNDFASVSYSAGQIGVHSDAALWKDFQQFWIDGFEIPVFREWLRMAITSGKLNLPAYKIAKFERCRFQPPSRKHIDPLKTHRAQTIALGDMSRSPFDVAAENGIDFEDVVEEFARARDLLASKNLPIPSTWGNFIESQIDSGLMQEE